MIYFSHFFSVGVYAASWVFIAGLHDITCFLIAADFSEFPAFAGVLVRLLASLLMLVSFAVGIAVLVLAPYSTVVVAVASVPPLAGFLAVADVPAVDGVPAVGGVPAVYGVSVVGGVSVVIGVLLLLTFLK
jgi:hypothetical protein